MTIIPKIEPENLSSEQDITKTPISANASNTLHCHQLIDKTLEKTGRIEYEARAEKAAREKWKALYDEALQQEQNTATSN